MHTRQRLRHALVLPIALLTLAPVSSRAAPPAAGTWSVTGSMHQPRGFQATILLASGLVLAAGGWSVNGPVGSAELYHPHTGTWAGTGSMHVPRMEFTATLLRDGRVLVAGGYSTNGPIAGAELYNPQSGTWTLTGSMHESRIYHTATLLPDGRVLVVGGATGGEGCVMQYSESYNGACSDVLASAELYDPRTGRWTLTSLMHQARARPTATLLPSGSVLVAGGAGGGGNMASDDPLASAELYDPHTGAWTLTGSMHRAASSRGATMLHNGLVLVDGGFISAGEITDTKLYHPIADAELYHPRSGAWTVTGSLHDPRGYRTGQTATLLGSGQVLVAGGITNGCPTVICTGVLASTELYDPGTGMWTLTGSLHEARAFQSAVLLPSGLVLVAGGSLTSDGSTATASDELYHP